MFEHSEYKEYIADFITEAVDHVENLDELSLKIEDGKINLQDNVNDIFRSVHSLKGGSSFLMVADKRFTIFNEFCHEFETLLDMLRREKIADQEAVSLTLEGLGLLSKSIEALAGGETPEPNKDYLDKCIKYQRSDKTSGGENRVTITLDKNIKTNEENAEFKEKIDKALSTVGIHGKIIVDFQGRARISSDAIGKIISIHAKVASLTMLSPPPIMELFFKRFGFNTFGIGVENVNS